MVTSRLETQGAGERSKCKPRSVQIKSELSKVWTVMGSHIKESQITHNIGYVKLISLNNKHACTFCT